MWKIEAKLLIIAGFINILSTISQLGGKWGTTKNDLSVQKCNRG